METKPGDGALALLRLLRDLPGQRKVREPLQPYTTFRIGGPAWVMYWPATVEALVEAVRRLRREGVPHRIVGGGAKTLFADEGFPGVVIHTKLLRRLKEHEETLWVEPGYPLAGLVRQGMWELAGIPGTAGGAVVMNAGTKHGSISSYVLAVQALLPDGEVRLLPKEECGFGYRTSLFRLQRLPVLGIKLRKPKEMRPIEDLLAERRRTQPLGLPSAGCIFRNPPSLSAGWLIDQAGLKGVRIGDAQISEQHANFIVNVGQAKACHVLALVELAQERVRKLFQISLELELEVVPA